MDSLLRRIGLGFVVWVGTALGQGAAAQQVAAPVLKVAGAEQPVLLEQARIDSRVAGGLGETRIELVFRNPNRRVLEGSLEFPLAEGQQVTGFALDIGGELRDAVPVPKAQGRQVFEAIERRGVDPGLLEQTAGNQFRLRIYPIPALGTRRVAITVREALPVEAQGLRWTLPLQFARQAQSVQLSLDAVGSGVPVANGKAPLVLAPHDGAWRSRWQGPGTALPAQLGWTLPLPRGVDAVRGRFDGEQYVMVQVPVPVQGNARPLPRRVGLLWDASGSARNRDTASELAVLDRYFRAIGNGEVQLTVLRDRAEPTRRFAIRQGDWSALRRHLEALPRDGASALGDWTAQADVDEYLLVSDGLANYDKRDRPELGARQRLYALSGAGAQTDSDRLRAWTRAGRGQLLVVDGAGDVEAAAARLLRDNPAEVAADGERLADLRVDAERAGHGWVRVLGRVQRGDAVLTLQVPDAHGARHCDGAAGRHPRHRRRAGRPCLGRCPASGAGGRPGRESRGEPGAVAALRTGRSRHFAAGARNPGRLPAVRHPPGRPAAAGIRPPARDHPGRRCHCTSPAPGLAGGAVRPARSLVEPLVAQGCAAGRPTGQGDVRAHGDGTARAACACAGRSHDDGRRECAAPTGISALGLAGPDRGHRCPHAGRVRCLHRR